MTCCDAGGLSSWWKGGRRDRLKLARRGGGGRVVKIVVIAPGVDNPRNRSDCSSSMKYRRRPFIVSTWLKKLPVL